MTKMTYAMAIDNAINGVLDTETVEKLTALKAQLAKRATSGKRTLTARQKENVEVRTQIMGVLADGEKHRATEVGEAIGVTGQRASALLGQLVTGGLVERIVEKRVTYFKAVEA